MKASCLHILASILFILSACNTIPRYTLYVPNTVHTPLIKEAGDYNITGCYGLVGGFQGQASYSPANHFLLLANGMHNFLIPKSDTTMMHSRNYEMGAGTYFNVYKKGLTQYQLNITAGYGQGFCFDKYYVHAESIPLFVPDIIYRQQLRSTYNKYFIQPSFDIVNPLSTFSISSKFAISNIHIDTKGAYVPNAKLNGPSSYNLYTLELALTNQRRYKYISTYFQYKVFIPVNGDVYAALVTSNGSATAQAAFAITFGITFNSTNIKALFTPIPSQGLYKNVGPTSY